MNTTKERKAKGNPVDASRHHLVTHANNNNSETYTVERMVDDCWQVVLVETDPATALKAYRHLCEKNESDVRLVEHSTVREWRISQ